MGRSGKIEVTGEERHKEEGKQEKVGAKEKGIAYRSEPSGSVDRGKGRCPKSPDSSLLNS